MCLLGVSMMANHIYGFRPPKTKILWAWIGISSQICEKIKSSYLQNYASDSHKIWQADVAQWKDFVGGPIWWCNKSKMADGRHLRFRFWAIISASTNIFARNLVEPTIMENHNQRLRIRLLKLQDNGRLPSWISKSYYKSVVNWDTCLKFCMMVVNDSGKSAVGLCISLKQQILYRKTAYSVSKVI